MTTLVESCSQLSVGMIKKDLRLARDKKAGIDGVINIEYGQVKAMADYYVEYGGKYDYLVINYGETEQRIKLTECELHFGTRKYFICPKCDRRVGKLYFPPHGKGYNCRFCLKLRYESTTICRNSAHGMHLYRIHQQIKAINMREHIPRIFWKSRYTKRFQRWMDQCKNAGIMQAVIDANFLMTQINRPRTTMFNNP